MLEKYGSPDVLRFAEVPRPTPGQGEILVRVRASTVTRTDTASVRGHPFFARAMTGLLRPKFRTTGIDFAGEVAETGPGVTEFAAGDRVFGLAPDSFGAHAEFLKIPVDRAVAKIPDGLDFADAVCAEGAWYAHGTTKLLKSGQRILIYGASGAIGTAAVQLARAQGAQVTAVVGTRHLGLAAELGAERVIDYTAEDFTKLGETFDVVLDAVGHTSYFACKPLLTPDGVYSATDLGPAWSNIWLSLRDAATGRKRVRIPFPEDSPGFVRLLAGHLAAGRFRGVVDRHYPFTEIVDAFRYVETGQKTGIVVVDF